MWVWKITQPKNEWIPAIHNNIDGPWRYYAEWNKSERERQIPYDFTHMWNLNNNKTNKQKNKTKTNLDTENGLEVTRREEAGGVSEMGEGGQLDNEW